MTATEVVEARPARRSLLFPTAMIVVSGLLFGLPWWTLLSTSAQWPDSVFVLGTILFALAWLSFPVFMFLGHGRHLDWAARLGDTMLGVIWVLFAWALLSNVLRLGLLIAGVDNPGRSRIVAVTVGAISLVLVVWGYFEAMRVPRIRRVEVAMPRLGQGLDGLTVALLTDTHYGPINRAKWSRGVTEAINKLDADIVCHTGDIADGTADQRREQAAPLGDVRAKMARTYVTGNHEYYSEAEGWLGLMRELGWKALRNRHMIIERGGDRLVLAGVDDATAESSRLAGHKPDLAAALAGADPELPVLLLAHQPKQISDAVEHGVDLQISGHTHGGQIWPFHLLVRVDQPALQGLTRHSERTQLYTSRGAGFWGPPLRVFAPSEITLITLRQVTHHQPAAR